MKPVNKIMLSGTNVKSLAKRTARLYFIAVSEGQVE